MGKKYKFSFRFHIAQMCREMFEVERHCRRPLFAATWGGSVCRCSSRSGRWTASTTWWRPTTPTGPWATLCLNREPGSWWMPTPSPGCCLWTSTCPSCSTNTPSQSFFFLRKKRVFLTTLQPAGAIYSFTITIFRNTSDTKAQSDPPQSHRKVYFRVEQTNTETRRRFDRVVNEQAGQY